MRSKMKKLFRTSAAAFIIATNTVAANPWEILEGSTLLDGTETASRVAGYMFSGDEYEWTSAKMLLSCEEGVLQMYVVGDGDLLTSQQFAESPVLDIMVKAGPMVETFSASVSSKYNRQRAQIHNGPRLLELFRANNGRAENAKVQLPVARTGVPEVRSLSLESVKTTTDVILSTCGPLDVWVDDQNIAEVKDGEREPNFMNDLSVAAAQKVVEALIVEHGATIEEIAEALKPLKDKE